MAVHAGAHPGHFEEALASMRSQSHPDLRLLVYADGPLTEAHEQVLARHLRTDSGTDVIVRGDRPVGLPTGLNRLIDTALDDPRVSYLARMDADDVSLPERIARQVDFLQRHPDVSVAGTWVIEFTEPGVAAFHKRLPTDPGAVARFMLYRSPLAHPTVMFRRDVFERGHRYNVRRLIMQDYELWSRLLLAGETISNVPDYLLWYRMAPGFYSRRTGLERAWGEVSMRFRFAWRTRQLRVQHLFGFSALFVTRMLPAPLKRLAYRHLRGGPHA